MKTFFLNMLLYAIIALSIISCHSYSKERVRFDEVDIAIQDTMLFFSQHYFSLKDNIINYSSNYVKMIMNVESGKKYDIDLGSNLPHVIKDGYLYIPEIDDILFCDTITRCYFIKIKLP